MHWLLATLKRVVRIKDTQLVAFFIRLQLICYVFFDCLRILPYVIERPIVVSSILGETAGTNKIKPNVKATTKTAKNIQNRFAINISPAIMNSRLLESRYTVHPAIYPFIEKSFTLSQK